MDPDLFPPPPRPNPSQGPCLARCRAQEVPLPTAFVLPPPPRILVDLLKLNVAPLAVFQMLKSMCAGQRLTNESQDPVAMPAPAASVPESRG